MDILTVPGFAYQPVYQTREKKIKFVFPHALLGMEILITTGNAELLASLLDGGTQYRKLA